MLYQLYFGRYIHSFNLVKTFHDLLCHGFPFESYFSKILMEYQTKGQATSFQNSDTLLLYLGPMVFTIALDMVFEPSRVNSLGCSPKALYYSCPDKNCGWMN